MKALVCTLASHANLLRVVKVQTDTVFTLSYVAFIEGFCGQY